MYLPAHFEESRPDRLHALLRSHPLGLLVTQDSEGALSANNLPFILDTDPAGGPGILRAHVARANPLWREARGDADALVVFQGPQAYISPSFYPSKTEHGKVVPTWNYVMVQARGRLRAVDDADWLHARDPGDSTGSPGSWGWSDLQLMPSELAAYAVTDRRMSSAWGHAQPQAPMWPQAVQKSQPSRRITAALPHSAHCAPGIACRGARAASGACRMPISSIGSPASSSTPSIA